jgi:hypothetical protein
MMKKLLLSILFLFLFPHVLVAESESSFLPTWKLMKYEEKQHFISGYIQGWIDAAKVTDIAIGYVKENPTKAVEGLQSIRKLYDLSAMSPQNLVQELDVYFAKSENANSSLSAAITAAKTAVISRPLPE